MRDQLGRSINYMRLSITDKCDMRCLYCVPGGIRPPQHLDVLSYEELLAICRAAVALGVACFKVTGGEPLARRGCVDFIRRLKALPGVREVTLTTNGSALDTALEGLAEARLDGLNISLDTLNPEVYTRITGADAATLARVLSALERAAALGLRVKVNAVLIAAGFPYLTEVIRLAERLPVDVRLIELMPIGGGGAAAGVPIASALALCRRLYPGLHAVTERRGNGPARYYAAPGLLGRIGAIDAVSHPFCEGCNRIRLTCTGKLKPCLCYEEGVALRSLAKNDASFDALCEAMRACIYTKPAGHCFLTPNGVTEHEGMNEIGG